MEDEKIRMLADVIGVAVTDDRKLRNLLEAADGNVQHAVALWFEMQGAEISLNACVFFLEFLALSIAKKNKKVMQRMIFVHTRCNLNHQTVIRL
jgi:hypothetical protein